MTTPTAAPRSVVDRARDLWQRLAGDDTQFPVDGTTQVVLAPGAQSCPQGWLGIVCLDGSTLVTVPDASVLGAAHALTHLDPRALTDPDVVRSLIPVDRVLGPARLAYRDPASWARDAAVGPGDVEALPPGHPDVTALLEASGADEADESGVAEISSDTFVVREGRRVVAACGYRRWPADVAHLCVLVDPAARRRGLAVRVAQAATDAAVVDGLLPQWRGSSEASVRTARRLGYGVLGAQLSVSLGASRP